MRVLKFGGTSVGSLDRFAVVLEIIERAARREPVVVVLSALSGVTNGLLQAIEWALGRDRSWEGFLQELQARHAAYVARFARPEACSELLKELTRWIADLRQWLAGIEQLEECSPRVRDRILGVGERLLVPIAAEALQARGLSAQAWDATRLIRTDAAHGEANVDWEATEALVRAYLLPLLESQIPVVTGFIGATEEGVPTTLGRGGSDYTATLLGAALGADVVEIWTDVDGVQSADPRLVPEAFVLPRISYREAAEMAYFGAKVLHPKTMHPLERRRISVWIRNTFRPEAEGTWIGPESELWEGCVKAITSLDEAALLTIEGYGLMGGARLAARLFGLLDRLGVSVILSSQASSDESICFVVRADQARAVLRALYREFAPELAGGQIRSIALREGIGVVAAVGSGMEQQAGIAGRFFGALGRSRINVLAVSDGASHQSVSVVLDRADLRKAVSVLHGAFFLSHNRVSLLLAGPTGQVGRALLRQLRARHPWLLEALRLELRLVGVITRSRMRFDPNGLPLDDRLWELLQTGPEADWEALLHQLQETRLEHAILVDCTASEAVARRYEAWLRAGVAVVTPNKFANTLEWTYYEQLKQLSERGGVPYRYETTVGSAMPLVQTVEGLRRTGDRLHRLEGVLSGTLSFVFEQLRRGVSFSLAVRQAYERGYTEPHPMADLSGEDVARKLLILLREAGWRLERSDIAVEPLFCHQEDDLERFWGLLAQEDERWMRRLQAAQQRGRELAYVARFNGQVATVGVAEVDPNGPLGHLTSGENIVVLYTDRYRELPLIVRGPGAGAELTAAGVLADILQAARELV
ncbi:MAG: bifunctional aspartate kinase/homoserine dehydrogenase I [Bacteroidetes bacterium]|nr:bifunctional aspartate kinase/homoserine dehydrogenase I [Rhodothermia bacterium]MCS7155645.1 bifunctional aspartate kinase/homoserine dehydrogenase I [Bacteroidota bacterium]MCX7906504.1 bifunctional aspartate kinase/homoserine dehydrogenase I [Bacteroidota bacterium]MDW8137215.1 bifunctional aspartate kinase/homoserine dehydrogenase I [Bacteroidota bacterium]MDW8284915.1 bifunctional aspartate kinase/homoserine dehydrogenase I [Bacteroidota bacterium]